LVFFTIDEFAIQSLADFLMALWPVSTYCQSKFWLKSVEIPDLRFFDPPQGKPEMNKSLVIASLIAAAALAACGKKEEPAPAPAPAPAAAPAAPAAPAVEAASAAAEAASAPAAAPAASEAAPAAPAAASEAAK